MEKVGDIIWDITKYLCGCAKQQVELILDLKENLQSLKSKWEKLEAIKKDVEAQIEEAESTREMQRSDEVKVWLQSIQNMQEEIKGIQVQGAQEIQNKCLSKCCPKNCKSSYKLGKNVVKMLTKVDDLTTEGQGFGKDHQITRKLPRKPIDQIPLEEILGQDLIFDKVWNSIEAKEVGVVGLYGTGGVGKTTLLKKINNEFGKRRPDFFVIWVVVSREPNLDRIMNNIRKSAGIGDNTWESCNSQEERSSKILGVLKERKFVLLLDDVWDELDLISMGVPHLKDTQFEYKVLFTTRLKDVCAKMHAQKSFKVEFLKEKEALELFQMKVGEGTLNSHPRIKVLAKEMAAECKGLPLALIVVGSAMAGVESVEAWECSRNSLSSSSWTSSNLEARVFSILKLSYDQLPDDTHRNCFLYCALYPEDYEILVNDIIDKWIGEGLLCKNMTKNLQDIRNDGQSVLAKLKLCCLLESVEDDVDVYRSFKMHDMIRDMALWLGCDQGKSIKKVLVQGDATTASHDDVEKWEIVERISVMKAGETWRLPPITCPNLVTLLLRFCRIECLQNMRYLSKVKVLELNARNVYNLGEIGELVLLEYLCLMIDVSEFPKELKNLKILKVFNLYLRDATIVAVPLGVIPSLQQLRVLRVACGGYSSFEENREEEREFLEEVECLPRIQELSVEISTKSGLNKLLDSDKLQSCIRGLRLWKLAAYAVDMPLLLAGISKMKRLRLFAMTFLLRLEDSCVYDTCCLTTLRSVAIWGCASLKHVTWLKYAPSLQLLDISICLSMEQVIKEEDENVNSSSLFSSLVCLTLYEMPELQSIHNTALSFPYLKSITISGCPKLKKLPLHSNSARHKLTFIRGKQDWWDSLEWDDPAAKRHFQTKFQPSTSTSYSINNALVTTGLDFAFDL